MKSSDSEANVADNVCRWDEMNVEEYSDSSKRLRREQDDAVRGVVEEKSTKKKMSEVYNRIHGLVP